MIDLILIAQLAQSGDPTLIKILLGGYAAMTTGFVALYRDTRRAYNDCRKDREMLWTRIRELEAKIMGL